MKELSFNRSSHLRMSWLRERYEELVADQSYEVANRVYMLHLVPCTLFADKSGVFSVLDMYGCSVASKLPVGLEGVTH